LTRGYHTDATLRRATLRRADLTKFSMSKANFVRANLTEAVLVGADMSETVLIGANLTGVDLTRADLSRANLSGANLTGRTCRAPSCGGEPDGCEPVGRDAASHRPVGGYLDRRNTRARRPHRGKSQRRRGGRRRLVPGEPDRCGGPRGYRRTAGGGNWPAAPGFDRVGADTTEGIVNRITPRVDERRPLPRKWPGVPAIAHPAGSRTSRGEALLSPRACTCHDGRQRFRLHRLRHPAATGGAVEAGGRIRLDRTQRAETARHL